VNVLQLNPVVFAALSGAVAVAGFAPSYLFSLPVLALALLFYLWGQARNGRNAAWLGFGFGVGFFSAGISWIYVALHDFGHMPTALALIATLLFAAFLALFPAAAGYLQSRIKLPPIFKAMLLLPALWVGMELLRGYLFTGFPWLTLGYSQVPASPLLGYAAVLGVYGVSLALATSAGLLTLLLQYRWTRQGRMAAAMLMAIWFCGAILQQVEWTKPIGDAIKVSLLQGNIEQGDKFEEAQFVNTLETYRRLAEQSDARLIVFPETALPLLRENLPERYADILRQQARQNAGDILIGSFEQAGGRFYNSVFSLGSASEQVYRKNHLVPFGEFIPLRAALDWLINDVLDIPMSDLARGGAQQPVLDVAGQRVAVNICYEDVFGEEIIRALPQATLLVNVSNDAWYGESHAAIQHNQISQMRAVETGRMMLRATNTGVTSVIDRDGQVLKMLAQHEEGVLTTTVQGYAGSTPYVRWGNWAVLIVLSAMLFAVWWGRKKTVVGEVA
jgi:apolipoprotein N-acyltransferase